MSRFLLLIRRSHLIVTPTAPSTAGQPVGFLFLLTKAS